MGVVVEKLLLMMRSGKIEKSYKKSPFNCWNLLTSNVEDNQQPSSEKRRFNDQSNLNQMDVGSSESKWGISEQVMLKIKIWSALHRNM